MRVVIDYYHLEGMQPILLNVWLSNLSTENAWKLYFSIKKTLARKAWCLLATPYVPIIGFYGESAKNCREKVGLTKFCLGAVITVRITENSPAIKILATWKRPDGMPRMSPRICVKDYFNIVVIPNFRLYSTDFWLLPAPF